jgi:hypothetical protein
MGQGDSKGRKDDAATEGFTEDDDWKVQRKTVWVRRLIPLVRTTRRTFRPSCRPASAARRTCGRSGGRRSPRKSDEPGCS